MIDTIVDHAIENVWCTPDQDNQHIFQPARLSPPRGLRRQTSIEWNTIFLPDQTRTWHLYQIGQLSPLYLNLIPDTIHWHCSETVCQESNLLVNAYVVDGRQYPRSHVFFKKTKNRNLLVAIPHTPRLPDLKDDTLYLRFYTNAYFQSDRSNTHASKLSIYSEEIKTRADVVRFQRTVRDLTQLPGHVSVYRNGWLVDNVRPSQTDIGDFVEYVHDASVYDVVDFPIQTLETFTSIRDNVHKYLLSRDKGASTTIDFVDDIDVYLCRRHADGMEGVFFHKNQHTALRQLTHQDYSVPVGRVVSFANEFDHWHQIRDLTIRLKIRKSGYNRSLVWEHGRIHELYHLPDNLIYQAMAGTNSTVSVWRAAALENAGYPLLMETEREDITEELVQDAYGYHAISKIIADTPQPVETVGSWRRVELPPGLQYNSTVFEYDSDGVLLGWSHHPNARHYTVNNIVCNKVEVLAGKGSPNLDTHYGHDPVSLESDYNYRMYLSTAVAGVSNDDWWDVTDDEGGVYDIVDGEVVWKTDEELTVPAVRSDRDFLLYSTSVPFQRGYLRFNVRARENHGEISLTTEMTLPPGEITLFLNGHSLIENLDYFVKWPEVMVVNKAFLIEGVMQNITVRVSGFCQPDMSMEAPAEVGYVTHGLLSRNNRYNLREDKVMRMVVDGKLMHTDELYFSEPDSGLRMDNVRNGAPYQLSDIVVPIRGLVGTDPYTFRQRSLTVDREIEDYLTLLYPENEIPLPSIIPHRHVLYSPFLSAIHEDMIYNILRMEDRRHRYSDMDIKQWLKDYEWLLDFEPLYRGIDDRYVLVQAHRFIGLTNLDTYQYTFLIRVIELYFPGRVDLTHSSVIV